MNFREEFNLSIRARCAVLYVTTREEERLLSVVKDCAAELENMRVVSWDFASGFDVGVAVGKGNPIAVLDFIAKEPADTPILYVLKDFHRFLEDNMVCRMVKNLAVQLKPQQKSILIVSPVYKVPEELTSSVSVLEFQLPTLPELREYITNITQNVVVDMDKEGFEQFVRAFQGLTISTVKTILSKALARSGKISLDDLQLVLEEKIAHGGHPVLRWMMDNIFIRTDPAGNIKADKEKSTEKIDGAIATIMGLDRAIRCGNDTGASVYDSRGLLFI